MYWIIAISLIANVALVVTSLILKHRNVFYKSQIVPDAEEIKRQWEHALFVARRVTTKNASECRPGTNMFDCMEALIINLQEQLKVEQEAHAATNQISTEAVKEYRAKINELKEKPERFYCDFDEDGNCKKCKRPARFEVRRLYESDVPCGHSMEKASEYFQAKLHAEQWIGAEDVPKEFQNPSKDAAWAKNYWVLDRGSELPRLEQANMIWHNKDSEVEWYRTITLPKDGGKSNE